ncbi:MAG: cyclic dehypoxanthinyl futalosine synthase [Thermodesulfovibrionales bacterium]
MKRITREEALKLLTGSDLLELGEMADEMRKGLHPEGRGTFIVDRNINYTNVCINKCRFCAFYRDEDSPEAYILSKDEISRKIDETIALGGTQILLQGGIHPGLDLDYYKDLLSSIKERYRINVHGFSPPEITYLAEKHNLSIRDTLTALRQAGLDSIPGGGAEILSDRVREVLSPKKIKSSQWLKVMEEAHLIGMRTTATMMFGSVETPEDIIEHLDVIRELQDRTGGFTAFIPWSFQPGNTEIGQRTEVRSTDGIRTATAVDYLRVLALSRVYLDNVRNVQASWVTQGVKMAQIALRFGANDFGSTMIEENVVKAAGVSYRVSKEDIIQAIRAAGFMPAQRDTYYSIIREF